MRKVARIAAMNRTTPVTFDREAALEAMGRDVVDVLVVGGGITGVSVALDAATRGLSVVLVERDDFASGTSSASSKMIHGGLRYVEQKQYRLVIHSLLERQRLYERAPHLVSRLPFLFPVHREGGLFSPARARAYDGALWLYDLFGGWRIRKLHRMLSPDETLTHCPGLRREGLAGGLLYYDTRTDDARLTLAVARTAAAHGALLANHCELTGLGPRVDGVRVAHLAVRGTDGTVNCQSVRARVVVNATGVWSDQVDTIADEGHDSRIRPAKGVHVVVPWEKVRAQSTLVFPMLAGVRGEGGTGFVVRWGDYCYIGTTDTPYEGDLADPRCERTEAQLLLESLNAAMDAEPVTVEDVTGTWAGLRPLIDTGKGSTAELSRTHEITESDGVVTVAGGKLTVSRQMAEQAVDKVCRLLGRHARCTTHKSPILGGAGFDAEAAGVTGGRFGHLVQRYGTESRFVEDIAMSDPHLAEPMTPELPYLWAEAVFAIRHEMAVTVTDVLTRRIPARFLHSAAAASIAPRVAEVLHQELGTPREQLAVQVAAFLDDVEREKAALRIGDAVGVPVSA